jgi:hypothetical protein
VILVETKEKIFPTYALLVATGRINSRAKSYILENVGKPHVRFLDIDSIIPEIDQHFPELWLGIDSDKFPYLKRLKDTLLRTAGEYALSDLLPPDSAPSSVSDDMFVKLYLNRTTFRIVKKQGRVIKEPKLEEFPATSLLNRKEHRFLILGEAGSGKSTILRRLAYTLADRSLISEKKINIPILIRAADLARTDKSILEASNETTAKLTLSNKSPFTASDLQTGVVLSRIFADV